MKIKEDFSLYLFTCLVSRFGTTKKLQVSQTREKKNLMRIVVSWVDRLDELKKQFRTKMSIETVSLLYQ